MNGRSSVGISLSPDAFYARYCSFMYVIERSSRMDVLSFNHNTPLQQCAYDNVKVYVDGSLTNGNETI